MLRRFAPLSLIISVIFIYSCHKSNNGAGNSGQLTGNYKFLYISAVTQSTEVYIEGTQTQKIVVKSSYTTIDNTGTVKITADSITTMGIGYSTSFRATEYVYFNDQLYDTSSFPSTASVPSSSATTKYDVIGQDSIYFEGGYPVPDATGNPGIAPPSGGRFSFNGDTLFIVSSFQDTISTAGSSAVSASASGVATTALLKQ
jgi:hypothetical protein